MSDDLVTRLRAFIPLADGMGDDLHAEDLRQAAEEIERLRVVLKMTETRANRWRDRALKAEVTP